VKDSTKSQKVSGLVGMLCSFCMQLTSHVWYWWLCPTTMLLRCTALQTSKFSHNTKLVTWYWGYSWLNEQTSSSVSSLENVLQKH